MGVLLGYLFIFVLFIGLVSFIDDYVQLAWSRVGFSDKHPLSFLMVSGFIGAIGLVIGIISPSISDFIIDIAIFSAVVIVVIYFIYAMIGFFKS